MAIVPKGTYRAKATRGEYGVSPNKGTDFIAVAFQIVEEGEQKGQSVGYRGFFTELTTERTIELLRFAGCTFPGNDITNLEGLGTTEVSIVVEHETYKDDKGEEKTVAKIAWVNSLGGAGRVKPEQRMDPGQKASFKQRMMGRLVADGVMKPAALGIGGSKDPLPF